MGYKMKGFSGFKASAVKQTLDSNIKKKGFRELTEADNKIIREAFTPKKIAEQGVIKNTGYVVNKRGKVSLSKKSPPLKQKAKHIAPKFPKMPADPSKDYKHTKPYFKPSSEVMHPPYRRPVGPTEKRHGVHRGDQLMDNLDTEFQPRKNKYHTKDRLKK